MSMMKLLVRWGEDGVVTEAFRPSGSLLANVNLAGQVANARGDMYPVAFSPVFATTLLRETEQPSPSWCLWQLEERDDRRSNWWKLPW
jgi:hypothetical protein